MERSEITWMPTTGIRPYERNPRRNDKAVDREVARFCKDLFDGSESRTPWSVS